MAELVDALDSKSSSARSVGSSPTRATRNINHHFGGFIFGPVSDEKSPASIGPHKKIFLWVISPPDKIKNTHICVFFIFGPVSDDR